MIRIRSLKDGFRRCGVAHSAEAVDWPDDAWTEAQLARLEADPMLSVRRLDGEPAPAGVPAGGDERLDLLVAAVGRLPAEGFAQDGRPRTDALAAELGERVSAAERDAAWTRFQEQAEASGETGGA